MSVFPVLVLPGHINIFLMTFTNILLITQFKRSARVEMQTFFIICNFSVNEKRSFQLLGKREKKLKIFLLKKARTILRLARKGLSLFWLVIFLLSRRGLVRRRIPAGEYGWSSRQSRAVGGSLWCLTI